MRRHGVTETAAGLVPFGHLGWAFGERDEFLARAAEYIVDGLACNQRISYVGEDSPEALRGELADMPVLSPDLDLGAVDVLRASVYYVFRRDSDVLDVDKTLAKYIEAAGSAVAAGYTGFRAIVDVTSVAKTVEQREALAALEYLVDQQMAVLPFSALCAYDTDQLGPSAPELICLHPIVAADTATFQIYAEPESAVDFVLRGEIDAASHQTFVATLQRIVPLTSGQVIRVEARDLAFIGSRQLVALDEVAHEHDRTVALHTAALTTSRLADLLDLNRVYVGSQSIRP